MGLFSLMKWKVHVWNFFKGQHLKFTLSRRPKGFRTYISNDNILYFYCADSFEHNV